MVDARNNFEPSIIDYRKLAAGLDYYKSKGYTYIEAPWVISPEATAVTLPDDRSATSVLYGDLVGSGEQSFIELMRRGHVIIKACCITPCFRDEDSYDTLHHAYFMKLELIDTEASHENLQGVITDARQFYERYTEVDVERTGEGTYDIVDRKTRIELGSYGFRAWDNTTFIYGTGLALPRLDTAIGLSSEYV